MATYDLYKLNADDGNGGTNTFEFHIAGISYCDGLQAALDLKATNTAVVHLANSETITGYKTFSNGLEAAGTTTVNALEVSGNQHNDGTLTVDSTLSVGSTATVNRLDSNGAVTGTWAQFGSRGSSSGGRVYVYRSSSNNCGYEWGNECRSYKLIANGTQFRLSEAAGQSSSPSSEKVIMYSSGTGDNTAYYFNGNASTATTCDMATTVKDYGHTSSTSSNEGIMIGWGSSSMTAAEYLAVYHYNSTTKQAYIKDMNITDAYHLSLSGRTLGLNFGSSTVISCGTVTLPGTNVVFNEVGTDTNTLYCV